MFYVAPQKKVAIIHRDADLVDALSTMASDLGYNARSMVVDSKTTPENVHDFVTDMTPDLVLLAENYQGGRVQTDPDTGYVGDVKVGEGIDALVEIRKTHPDTPVFMVSGGALYREIAMQKGATGYLDTPIIELDDFEAFLKENT